MTDVKAILSLKLKSILGSDAAFDINVPESQFGDYSTNAAMIAAKTLKQAPLEVAGDLVSKLQADGEVMEVFSKIEAVKPGFINFHLKPSFLTEALEKINKHPQSFGSSDGGKGKLVLVEYFQLNVAKPPHVGHLRSAVIGDSLKRLFISQGYKTVSDTHIGDWGTQFGILIWAYKNLDGAKKVDHENALEDLNKLYVEANALIEEKPEVRDQAKAEFVKLEEGDRENRKLWEFFISVSKKEFDRMTEKLKLLPFEYDLGESFYESRMKEIISKLEKANLLTTGETGEKYVDLEEYKLGRLIALKSDGGTTYELRDLATLAYRYDELGKGKLSRNLYVVDSRQAHDFKQVFKTMELLGYDVSKSRHIEYGFLELPEGAISTRKGNAIALEQLIKEAESRALQIINEKNVGLKDKDKVAEVVGLGALKYADLKHNRRSNIVFRWEDALSFEGDTGPYLQYTHARLCSILRKHDEKLKYSSSDHDIHEIEFEVLRKIIHFPEILKDSVDDFAPNVLANYLYELSGLVNNFYHSVPVLGETNDVLKDFRLSIVHGAATTLKNGLYLLGIEAPEEM